MSGKLNTNEEKQKEKGNVRKGKWERKNRKSKKKK